MARRELRELAAERLVREDEGPRLEAAAHERLERLARREEQVRDRERRRAVRAGEAVDQHDVVRLQEGRRLLEVALEQRVSAHVLGVDREVRDAGGGVLLGAVVARRRRAVEHCRHAARLELLDHERVLPARRGSTGEKAAGSGSSTIDCVRGGRTMPRRRRSHSSTSEGIAAADGGGDELIADIFVAIADLPAI